MQKKRKNIYLLGWVSLFTDISSQMIYPLLPSFLVQIGATATIIGVIEGIAESIASLFRSVFGRLSDKVGKRKPFIYLGYGLSAVAKPFLFFATVWGHVLGIKFAERMGKAARKPARDALLSVSVDPENRGRDFGIQRSMDRIGSVLGPIAAMVILYFAPENYRLVFLLAVIPALIALLFISFVKEFKTEKSQARPISNTKSYRSPVFYVFLVTGIIFTLGNSSNAFLLLKASESGIAIIYLPFLWMIYNMVAAISSPIMGGWSDRIGRKPVLIVSFAFYGVIYLLFSAVTSIAGIFVLFAIYGLHYGLFKGVSAAYINDITEENQRGSAYGDYDMGIGLALLPASLIMGFVWDGYGSSTAFSVAASFSFVALIIFVLGNKIYTSKSTT